MKKSNDRDKFEWFFSDALIRNLNQYSTMANPLTYDEIRSRVKEATDVFMMKRDETDDAYLYAMDVLLKNFPNPLKHD